MSQCFVGGVHYDIGMKDIREAFAPFGVIKTVDLNVDPLTGRHKVSSRHFRGIWWLINNESAWTQWWRLTECLGLCLRRIWFTRKFSIGNWTNARYKTSKSCNTSWSSYKYWSIPRNDRFNYRKVEKSGLRLNYFPWNSMHVKFCASIISCRW